MNESTWATRWPVRCRRWLAARLAAAVLYGASVARAAVWIARL
ncbi:hypothetical protein AB4Y42_06110 [Paraburkholderia sp. EG286B]